MEFLNSKLATIALEIGSGSGCVITFLAQNLKSPCCTYHYQYYHYQYYHYQYYHNHRYHCYYHCYYRYYV